MQPLVRILPLALLFVAGLRADTSLAEVRRARDMLGPGLWSRIIRVENTAQRTRYPSELHALVFELAGLLWFYTPVNGTQSFSLHAGNLAAEKANFGPLLRDIEPGFRRWNEVNAGESTTSRAGPLANGCFIESVAALRRRVDTGERVRRPRLLSYYVDLPRGMKGHTVLAFERGGELVVVDAATPGRRICLPLQSGASPLELARAFDDSRVARARELKLDAVYAAWLEAAAGVARTAGAGVPGV